MSLVKAPGGGVGSVKQISLYFSGRGDEQHVLPRACEDGCPLPAALQGAPKEQEKEREGLAWL